MFCGLPISVAAEPMLAAQARPIRNGIGFSPRCRHRRATTGVIARQIDVVGEHRRQRAGHRDQRRQQAGARQRQRADAARDRGVEAAQPHLRRHHHEGEQQHDGGQVDRARGVFDRHAGERDHRDGAQQRHAGAVQLQARQAAEEHAQVDHGKDGDDAPVERVVAEYFYAGQIAQAQLPLRALPARGQACTAPAWAQVCALK